MDFDEPKLGGGFKYFICSPLPGEMRDDPIWLSWNHQLENNPWGLGFAHMIFFTKLSKAHRASNLFCSLESQEGI